MSTYMSRLLPRSNTSFLLSTGNALQSEVVRLSKDMFLLDSGLTTPRVCMKEELTRVPTNPNTTRFNEKVGFLDKVTGEAHIQKHLLERFFIDIVAGDSSSKERAAARFNDIAGGPTPTDGGATFGEPLILFPRRFRQKLALMELKKIQQRNGNVNGFVISKVRFGYCVAVAGFIAFLPARYLMHSPRNSLASGKFNANRLIFKF